jgi:hypothetical protein
MNIGFHDKVLRRAGARISDEVSDLAGSITQETS